MNLAKALKDGKVSLNANFLAVSRSRVKVVRALPPGLITMKRIEERDQATCSTARFSLFGR